MSSTVEDLQKSVDRIDRDVTEVKKEVQGIISSQELGAYKNEVLVKSLEKIEQKLINIQDEVSSFKGDLKTEVSTAKDNMRKESYNSFVTKDQFAPVKNVVFGLVALILIAVITAWLAITIVKPTP